MSKIGPLLKTALDRVESTRSETEMFATAARFGGEMSARGQGILPVVLQCPRMKPAVRTGKAQSWQSYRKRILKTLNSLGKKYYQIMKIKMTPLITANAFQARITVKQAEKLGEDPDIELLELDPMVQVIQMDDAIYDIELPLFGCRQNDLNREFDGAGVRVAVLDSGVDTQHQFLHVIDSISTSGEAVDLPGSHGTHVAGSIASTDEFFPGVAPGVDIINVKVLTSSGAGSPTSITRGIDEALDRNADILSMSIGFNHMPTWMQNGHGWVCTDGNCVLCTAVDNAVSLDNVLVVVAAANEHDTAEALREFGFGDEFDTELGCPGQAREAFTVGATTKRTFLPAPFTSHGPTSYNTPKPDIAAPGVNITSTIPMPREMDGSLVPSPQRQLLFGRKSGTSMATPIVSGAAALLIQQMSQDGIQWSPATVRQRLLNDAIVPLPHEPMAVGHGRLNIGRI